MCSPLLAAQASTRDKANLEHPQPVFSCPGVSACFTGRIKSHRETGCDTAELSDFRIDCLEKKAWQLFRHRLLNDGPECQVGALFGKRSGCGRLCGLQGLAPQWALKDVDVGLPVSGVKERLPNLMEAYREEVLNGHVLTTAANSYYFTMLEFQRRFDTAKIQAETLRAVGASGCLLGSPLPWREQLEAKKAEAIESLQGRARHYAVGRRSASGLLYVSKGDEALDSYTETLATEYDAAAVEIEAVLAVLGTEREFHRERVVGLLVELERNAAFWEEEIEATFEVWQTACRNLSLSQSTRDIAWAELSTAAAVLLETLAAMPEPVDTQALGIQPHVRRIASQATDLLCARLLQLELHQNAHGMTSTQRQRLLGNLLETSRFHSEFGLAGVALQLIDDQDFLALGRLPVGNTGYNALDVSSNPAHPWAAALPEIFAQLLQRSSERRILEMDAIIRFLHEDSTPGWSELRVAAARFPGAATQCTPLHEAVRSHDTYVVHRLLNLGADPYAQDSTGESPLSVAYSDVCCPAPVIAALEFVATEGPQFSLVSE